jgi:hypothetical protein
MFVNDTYILADFIGLVSVFGEKKGNFVVDKTDSLLEPFKTRRVIGIVGSSPG